MLRPSKHSHPDRTVVRMAAVLLKRLRDRRLDDYDSLLSFSRKAVQGADFLFLPALDFLFLLGLIQYHPKTDSFEYVGKNETVTTV